MLFVYARHADVVALIVIAIVVVVAYGVGDVAVIVVVVVVVSVAHTRRGVKQSNTAVRCPAGGRAYIHAYGHTMTACIINRCLKEVGIPNPVFSKEVKGYRGCGNALFAMHVDIIKQGFEFF